MRKSIKQHLRELFPNVGDSHRVEELLGGELGSDDKAFTSINLVTAINDLKNPNYAGGPTMTLERSGDFKTGIFFTRSK